MSSKGILIAVAVLMFAACISQAADQTPGQTTSEQSTGLFQPQPGHDGKLHATFAVTYLSEFVWRGFSIYGSQGAIQPSVDVDLFGTGFGFSTYYSNSLTDGSSNRAWLPSTVYYRNGLFREEIYQINYTFGYSYFNFPGISARDQDFHEFFGSFCFPKILPFGVVPSYTLVYDTPAGDKSVNDAGWAHIFGLGYDLALPQMFPDTTEQVFHFTWETVYNDGVGPGNPRKPSLGRKVDHDWSHCVFGVTTDVPLAKNLFFVPGFFYQSSWDDSVNDRDQSWVSLAMKYSF